jgi:hypothetical protein
MSFVADMIVSATESNARSLPAVVRILLSVRQRERGSPVGAMGPLVQLQLRVPGSEWQRCRTPSAIRCAVTGLVTPA